MTDQRTVQDFALQMKALVDVHYPEAEKIRVVLDNLSTHTPWALYSVLRRRPAPPVDHVARGPPFQDLAHRFPERPRRHAFWVNTAQVPRGAEQSVRRRDP